MSDPFEPSRKLDAVSPALQAWAEALTDRISAISGNAQLAAIEAIDRLRVEVAADRNDRALVLEYLQRQEAAAQEQRALFQSFADRIDALEQRIAARDERSNRVQERVSTIETFIHETVATLQGQIEHLQIAFDRESERRTAFEQESATDRRGIHDELAVVQKELVEIKRLVGGD